MANETPPHPVLRQYYDREPDRQRFVTDLFDRGARYYDWVSELGSLGGGRFYRAHVLRRAGVRAGMRVLDLATGTGLVARAAAELVGDPRKVVGLDPSDGMLREARKRGGCSLVRGQAEALPFRDGRFDVVTMGYALRHVASLEIMFTECLRVLRPGGRLLLMEVSRPESWWRRWILRVHLQTVMPLIMRMSGRRGPAEMLTRYYWDTIAECVPPATILEVLRTAGFVRMQRQLWGGLLSEYVAVKPEHVPDDERARRGA